jgi:hypothetical protein
MNAAIRIGMRAAVFRIDRRVITDVPYLFGYGVAVPIPRRCLENTRPPDRDYGAKSSDWSTIGTPCGVRSAAWSQASR